MKRRNIKVLSFVYVLIFLFCDSVTRAQNATSVTAYFSGSAEQVKNIPATKLTHIIFSFCHLKGSRLNVDNAKDTVTIKAPVGLKRIKPKLKILLPLGGWGGCETCSEVFSEERGRNEFAKSTVELNTYFGADGIDLEYPRKFI